MAKSWEILNQWTRSCIWRRTWTQRRSQWYSCIRNMFSSKYFFSLLLWSWSSIISHLGILRQHPMPRHWREVSGFKNKLKLNGQRKLLTHICRAFSPNRCIRVFHVSHFGISNHKFRWPQSPTAGRQNNRSLRSCTKWMRALLQTSSDSYR